MRVSARLLAGALLSALGATPVACGGKQSRNDALDDEPSPNGRAGATGSVTGTAGAADATAGGTLGAGGNVGGQGSTTAVNLYACDALAPQEDTARGFERCGEDGPIYRSAIEECASQLPRANLPSPGEFDTCYRDEQCGERPHGYCQHSCAYGCVVDADCADGQICLCGEPVGRCVEASCRSDADCTPGFRCQSYEGFALESSVPNVVCGITRFACQSPGDSCGRDADCTEGELCNADGGLFECQRSGGDCSTIGRPFFVAGTARVAQSLPGADWSGDDLELSLGELGLETRRAAAEAWLRVALLEHASIAAFARFTLQLLSLGAPPQLVELSARAMGDETAHAKLAFTVACQLGLQCRPGSFDLTAALDGSASLGEVTRLAFREGCVGETVAALSAREAAAHTTNTALRCLLTRIADDETRHAELAWRFVRWAVRQQPSLAASIQEELKRAVRDAPDTSSLPEGLAELGILSGAQESELRRVALARVVTPCALLLIRATLDEEWLVASA